MVSEWTYDDGYAVGYEEGKAKGFEMGYRECEHDYEARLARYWAELITLNARVDRLQTQLDQYE